MERIPTPSPDRFAALWRSLLAIGYLPGVGCSRSAWSEVDHTAREWFAEEALDRDLTLDTDRNGNLYAWWGDPAAGPAVLTGSHLDSAPGGGPYRGALGVVSAVLAFDLVREWGFAPTRPVGVAVLAATDRTRFGEPCAGARLLTGDLTAAAAARLRDRDGVTLTEAFGAAHGHRGVAR
jgi:N-carbamoyl-L-amino-acid hydrolase